LEPFLASPDQVKGWSFVPSQRRRVNIADEAALGQFDSPHSRFRRRAERQAHLERRSRSTCALPVAPPLRRRRRAWRPALRLTANRVRAHQTEPSPTTADVRIAGRPVGILTTW
jgi:hypothetical protein